jgi:hypothetical protein
MVFSRTRGRFLPTQTGRCPIHLPGNTALKAGETLEVNKEMGISANLSQLDKQKVMTDFVFSHGGSR